MLKQPLHLSYLSIVIATLTLALSFAMSAFWWGIAIALLAGIAWCISIWRGWHLRGNLSLFCLILGISIGGLQEEGSRVALLISTVAALSAWDLAAFHQLLAAREHIANEEELTRTHLLRLVSVIILGLTLPLITFSLQFELQFWQAFLLGVILLLGLSQVFSQLKRSNTQQF